MNSGSCLRRCAEHLRPHGLENRVIGARRHRDVELGAGRRTTTDFILVSGSWIQEVPILVDVGKDQVRITLEAVVHAVTVMGIDVDVGDTPQAVFFPEDFHRDAAVVEHAETRGTAARRVVQAGDRHEPAPRTPLHDLFGGEQRRPDHVRGRLVHPTPGGSVAGIEVALTGQRPVRDQVDVLRGVKGLELGTRRRARLHHPHALVETARGELGEEGGVPVLPERVAVGKAVARQPFASHHQDR